MVRLLTAAMFALAAGMAHAGPVDDARQDYLAGDYEAALTVLRPAAEAGDANAQNILGAAYDDGNGVEQDHDLARQWWERAAAQDFSKALFNLGEFWLHGRPGFAPDYDKAGALFERAMEQDNADAIGNLGYMYELGLGREVDYGRAFELYTRASDLGAIFATGNLGSLYAQGRGVGTDFAKAYELISRAAAGGDALSFNNLAVMYEKGYHVQPNPVVAYALYNEAMWMGDPRAANNLADLLLQPGYFWSDRIEALAHCFWSRDNAPSEDIYATYNVDCDQLAATMSEAERADARVRAAEF